jgi:iron complex transport system ATP-binding protein
MAHTLINHPLQLTAVRLIRDDRVILDQIDWTVEADQRWLVLGANGSGKTTLLRIASLYLHPSSGEVRVLGETLGETDVRALRRRIGVASAALTAELRPELTATEIVMTAKNAALEPWWHRYTADDRAKAVECLDRFGVAQFAERSLGTLSSGEQQRVMLARSIMTDPGLVLLDEPSARLDLGGREQLVGALGQMALDQAAPPIVLITHHVDEVPPGITHALLLRAGKVIGCGPIEQTLTAESISECFAMPLTLERRANGRYAAFAR